MNKTLPSSIIWRWVALAAVLINIFFSYYINANPINGQTIGDVSDKYPTWITPAGYAFSIWGIIYLSFIIYATYQLLPSERNKQIYNRLVWPLLATSLLSIIWLISFSLEQLAVSVMIILGMLLTAILLFGWAKKASFRNELSTWVTIPFGLYLGWLSIAAITNIAVWFKDRGWQGGPTDETLCTIIIIVVTLAAGILISYIFRDIIYPIVIVWATLAIYVARQNENLAVAYTALITAIILALWAAGYGIWLLKNSQPVKTLQH